MKLKLNFKKTYFKNSLLIVLLLFPFFKSDAQITLENTYSSLTGQANNIFITNIGSNNYKYVVWDMFGGTFSLYNLDHTPYLLNTPLAVSDSAHYYQLGYITSTLFDCDSTNIEYALIGNSPDPSKQFLVYRTDGTLIFSRDSATTAFCLGCLGGSQEILGIINTPFGAKLNLITFVNGHYDFSVYSLCGSLPETQSVLDLNPNSSYVKVFPNPSSNNIQFQIVSPTNYDEYSLVIFNSQYQIIKSLDIQGTINNVKLNCESFVPGTFLYTLQNKNKIFQSGKFIISK
jgi:hypothetical protein